MTNVGHIKQIWRYPIKSMQGELLEAADVGGGGITGDRAWALRDEAAGEIRGAKKLPALLHCTGLFTKEPEPGGSGAAQFRLPDGGSFEAGSSEGNAALSEFLGRRVALCPLAPADDLEHYRRGEPDNPDLETELREMFGRLPDESLPDFSQFDPEIFEFTSPRGTYFDLYPLHVLTSASLAELSRLEPGTNFDLRRFRPNFLIESREGESGTVEFDWNGRDLRLGSLVISIIMPTVRCSMPTQSQVDLDKQPSVLRTIVRELGQNVGSYATVKEAGTVRVGDPVDLL